VESGGAGEVHRPRKDGPPRFPAEIRPRGAINRPARVQRVESDPNSSPLAGATVNFRTSDDPKKPLPGNRDSLFGYASVRFSSSSSSSCKRNTQSDNRARLIINTRTRFYWTGANYRSDARPRRIPVPNGTRSKHFRSK